jgi:hypothetical protein
MPIKDYVRLYDTTSQAKPIIVDIVKEYADSGFAACCGPVPMLEAFEGAVETWPDERKTPRCSHRRDGSCRAMCHLRSGAERQHESGYCHTRGRLARNIGGPRRRRASFMREESAAPAGPDGSKGLPSTGIACSRRPNGRANLSSASATAPAPNWCWPSGSQTPNLTFSAACADPCPNISQIGVAHRILHLGDAIE